MSNSIEYFQPQNYKSAVGAAAVNIYLDGKLCDFLSVDNITFAGEPDFNEAVLRDSSLHCVSLRMTEELHCGKKIDIKTVYDGGIGEVRPEELIIFSGFIEQIEIAQTTTIIAKDYSAKLKRRTVYGQKISSGNGNSVFIESEDTVFNPSGEPNLAKDEILFASDENDAIAFKCADAIYYLLRTYIAAGELFYPTLAQLKALTNDCAIRDVDVTGLNLIDAIARCCKQCGLKFKFSADSRAIVFYRPGSSSGREVELNCQWQGEKLDIAKTNIAEVSRKKNKVVTNQYIVQGDYKIFEATFNLVKGWNPALEANDYDRYSPNTNENFNDVRDVYRKWVLNEAGGYSASPYNQGSVFDFAKIFESEKYIRRKRRFLPSLTCGADGGSIGYYLEVSYTNGSKWWPYMNSFKVLLDQCGIWLSAEQLDTDLWYAIVKGVLKVRITASVVSDERINYTGADGAIGSIIEVVDKIVTLPKRFKYQKVSAQSAFAGGIAKEIDDTKSIVEYANNLCNMKNNVSENLQIKTMVVMPYFSPGDRIVCSPDSRDLLGVLYDTRNVCYIEKAKVDYVNQQTILTAVKRRK
ncbi:MAG: hypothetical protein A2Y12_10795 [Planctomycetes bacterium GWF2_42_9]|nr:MAG: hypothetical protein A2Y12_10795 [Planctomycetes bacterium GWF2_42_9]HAL45739.1 hypothetical protein [Phycisphaerales bacterium]